MAEDEPLLAHIQQSIALILRYTRDGRSAFMASDLHQAAILYWLIAIGEATKKLSSAPREQHPEIPWRAMMGARDVLVHNVLAVRLDQVWEIVENDLPTLAVGIDRLLERR
ncbi:MAG: HepT-like ribonuclease domain-containing protein [Dehalococcoidia bacterium]